MLIDAESGKPYVVTDNTANGTEHTHADEDDHAHFDPQAHSTLRLFILVGALALHAVFEGLVFG